MREVSGDLWDYWDAGDWIALTTNGKMKTSGEAVMGAGIAKVARDRFMDLSLDLGMHLQLNGNIPGLFEKYRIATFPTKDHWKMKSDLKLIKSSAIDLVKLIDTVNYRIERIALPRPGCGNGGLKWNIVKPLIADVLDDRFIVVQYLRTKREDNEPTSGSVQYSV